MKILTIVIVFFVINCATALAQTVRPPPQADRDKATADLASADPAVRDPAVEKVKAWIGGGWVSQDLWRKWIPSLVKAGGANSHQQVADLALLGLLHRPEPLAAVPLAEARFKALYALNKTDEAGKAEFLAAAKSYYNVCDLKLTANAVTLVAQALARTRPDDPELVRKFRAEQAAASSSVSCQWSVASGQLPVVSCQWPDAHFFPSSDH